MLPIYRCDIALSHPSTPLVSLPQYSPTRARLTSAPSLPIPSGGIVERRPRWAEAFPRTQRGYALPITRILHCMRAGAGQGSDDGRAPQPGAGSAHLRRTWCRYHCWREEPGEATAPGGIHGRPGQMIEPNVYPIRKPWITRLPSPLPLGYAYPYLVSTMCVAAGIIAMGAVVGDWPGGSVPRQPCYHVPDGLPYPLVMPVSRSLACGSHAAVPAVLTIRRVAYRYPSWSRGC